MASGRLATAFLSTTANTAVYTAPSDSLAVVTISVINLSSTTTRVTLSLTTSGTNAPAQSEYIEYNLPITADGGVYERSGVVISPNMKIVASSPISNALAINVWGFEQLP